MVKVFAFYKNIKDMKKFLEFYTETIIPKYNNLPGVLETNIIHLEKMSPDITQELDGLEMIVEGIYESKEAAIAVLTSPAGLEISKLLSESTLADMYIYSGSIKNFSPVSTPKGIESVHQDPVTDIHFSETTDK
jgi:hypothetical protein